MIFDLNTELRKLRPAELYNLGLILNPSDNWKKLMALVTKEGTDNVPKFPGEYIAIMEQAARQERKLAAAIFLEEWGTMGRKRPTLGLLLNLLMKAELFRAADYLAQDILKVEAPQRPASGPAAPVDIESIAELLRGRNLDDHSDSNDSDFCLRTTSEIRISQINYPSCIFNGQTSTNDNNLAIDDDDVGVFEMQYAESKSNQVLDHARIPKNPNSSFIFEKKIENLKNTIDSESSNDSKISDLMKFSASGASTESNCSGSGKGYSRSNLIKFDSEKVQSNENVELHEAIFPDLNILCPTVLTRSNKNSSDNEQIRQNSDSDYTNMRSEDCKVLNNREMSSTELPACLRSFVAAEETASSVDSSQAVPNTSHFHRELTSAELPLCIKDRTSFKSSGSNFNESTTFNSEDSSQENSAQSFNSEISLSIVNKSPKEFVSESELPCFVVEASKQERIEENNEKSAGYTGGNNALTSQELPITVLEFHKR